MTRDLHSYFPQKTTTITTLGQFHYRPAFDNPLHLVFDTWATQDSFVAGNAPISRLSGQFDYASEDLISHKAVLDQIADKALNILSVGGRGYELVELLVWPTNKFMLVEGRDPKTGSTARITPVGDDFDTIIGANLDLIVAAEQTARTLGIASDVFLASLTEV